MPFGNSATAEIWNDSTLKTTLNTTFYNTINSINKNYIQTVYWNISACPYTHNNWSGNSTTLYDCERTNNGSLSNSTYYYYGNIGLIYPSDFQLATGGGEGYTISQCRSMSPYSYVDENYGNNCGNNSWLQPKDNSRVWTMTEVSPSDERPAMSNHMYDIIFKDDSQGLGTYIDSDGNEATTSEHGVFPVLYLKNNVLRIGGNGTQSSPYTISI